MRRIETIGGSTAAFFSLPSRQYAITINHDRRLAQTLPCRGGNLLVRPDLPSLPAGGVFSPMPAPLQVGDRVRHPSKHHCSRFRPGDLGTIVAAVSAGFPQGMRVYQVRVDDGEATLHPAFYEEELEQ